MILIVLIRIKNNSHSADLIKNAEKYYQKHYAIALQLIDRRRRRSTVAHQDSRKYHLENNYIHGRCDAKILYRERKEGHHHKATVADLKFTTQRTFDGTTTLTIISHQAVLAHIMFIKSKHILRASKQWGYPNSSKHGNPNS